MRSELFPPDQHGSDFIGNERASLEGLESLSKELVITGIPVTDTSSHGQCDRLLVELPRGTRPANPSAVLRAGVPGDRLSLPARTGWKELTNPLYKPGDVCLLRHLIPGVSPDPRGLAARRILLTLIICPLDSRRFDEDALPLMTLARPGEFDERTYA